MSLHLNGFFPPHIHLTLHRFHSTQKETAEGNKSQGTVSPASPNRPAVKTDAFASAAAAGDARSAKSPKVGAATTVVEAVADAGADVGK